MERFRFHLAPSLNRLVLFDNISMSMTKLYVSINVTNITENLSKSLIVMSSTSVNGENNEILCISFLKNKQFHSYNNVFQMIRNLSRVWSKDSKIKIRAILADGETNIRKSMNKNFDATHSIECDFHLKRTARSEINKIYRSNSSPIRKGDKILIDCAYAILLISTFLPKFQLLHYLIKNMERIRCNKKPDLKLNFA